MHILTSLRSALALAGLITLVASCGKEAASRPAAEPPAVTVAPVVERAVNPGRNFVGRTAPAEAVAVRAQVTGELVRVTFLEGSDVREPYEAAVEAAQAALADAKARNASAQRDLRRLRSLAKDGVASRADLDNAMSLAEEAAAGVARARANLRADEIDLGYTKIHAPISGRTSTTAVNRGNIVGPDSGPLTTINALDPIYVFFNVSERDILSIRQEAVARGGETPEFVPRLELSTGDPYPHTGRIDFIDNHVDRTTATVAVRAAFPNPDRLLLPGQFVTVRVERDEPRRVRLVPQAAIQQDQSGHFVLTVDDADQVHVRRVTVGDPYKTYRIVEDGVETGEHVVYEGVQKVRPDTQVRPTVSEPPSALEG